MNAADPALVERLAAVRVLKSVPRNELEWIAAHGRFESFTAGTIMRPQNMPLQGLSLILSGTISIHVERAGKDTWIGGAVCGVISGTITV